MSRAILLVMVVNLLASLGAIMFCVIMLGVVVHGDHIKSTPLPVAEEAYLVNVCDSEGLECQPLMYHPFGDPFVFD